jgi:hypothetical protein
LVLLRPQENLLVLEVLHYRHQVMQPSALADEAPRMDVSAEELQMARTPGQRFHGRLQPGEVSGPLHPQTAAVDWSESGGPGACDSPGHSRTAGDQSDRGPPAKRGSSPGNQRSQEGTTEVHPTAGPEDLLRGTHGRVESQKWAKGLSHETP